MKLQSLVLTRIDHTATLTYMSKYDVIHMKRKESSLGIFFSNMFPVCQISDGQVMIYHGPEGDQEQRRLII